MKHYIDALYDLARAGQTVPFRRATKSTHDNPLRRLGREMRALAARQVRVPRIPKVEKTVNGAMQLKNPARREKALIRAFYLELTGRPMSGRAWRNSRKATNRAGTAG